MHDFDPFETRMAAALRADADGHFGSFDPRRVAQAAIAGVETGATGPARRHDGRVRRFGRTRGLPLLAAAALLLLGGAAFAGSGILRRLEDVPPQQDASLQAVVAPSPIAASPSPSARVTSPVPSASPLTWTEASLQQDWPAPLRSEPGGSSVVVPLQERTDTKQGGHYTDPTGDVGTPDFPWPDITDVTTDCRDICVQVSIAWPAAADPRQMPAPAADPRQQWVAYGVVTDDDGDGVADWRYGVDNVPAGTSDANGNLYRWWRTNLHTGETESAIGEHVWLPSGTMFYGTPGWMVFGGDVTGEKTAGGLPKNFYVWASVIQDGRVVGTDYAPDTGWLHPEKNARPTPTETPPTTSLSHAPKGPCATDDTTDGCLVPGSYRIGSDVLSVETGQIDVPAGWFEWDMGLGTKGVLVYRPDAKDGSGWGVVFSSVGTISSDPCDATKGLVQSNPAVSVTKLITTMQAWPGFEVSTPQPITMGGVSGQEVAVTSTRTTVECPDAVLWRTPQDTPFDAYPMVSDAPGEYTARFLLLDVAGTVLAIRTTDFPQTSPAELSQGVAPDPARHAADQQALHAILDSLRISVGY
jgi:hypothetical protein